MLPDTANALINTPQDISYLPAPNQYSIVISFQTTGALLGVELCVLPDDLVCSVNAAMQSSSDAHRDTDHSAGDDEGNSQLNSYSLLLR